MRVLSSRTETLRSRRHWQLVALVPDAHCLLPLCKQVYRGWVQVAASDYLNTSARVESVAAGGG